MAKVRVHELAKELGIPSRDLLKTLTENGEFVKSASSSIEAPVVRRAREYYKQHPELLPDAKPEPAKKETKAAGAKKKTAEKATAAKKNSGDNAATTTASTEDKAPASAAEAVTEKAPKTAKATKTTKKPGPVPQPAKKAQVEKSEAASSAPAAPAKKPTAPRPSAVSVTPGEAHRSAKAAREAAPPRPQARKKAGPRPGNSPFAAQQGMRSRGKPRPGNSPFAAQQGMNGARAAEDTYSKGKSERPYKPKAAPAIPSMFPAQEEARDNQGRGGRGERGANRFGNSRRGGHVRSGGKARGGSTAGAFGNQGGKRRSKRAPRNDFEEQKSPMLAGVQVPRGDGSTLVRVRSGASLADFAEKIKADPAALVTVLFRMGEMATANQSLDEDTFQLLGAELGYDIKIMSPEDEDREILEAFDIDLEAERAEETDAERSPRPPVVTVMGHVDHGKTKLLDAIRNADVVEGEAGGITQSIGAYQAHVKVENTERFITFIDTPGHEAFTQMRARGADVTDVAVLVVAANDGVMPQTVEAINHAKAAKVPIVVAVNKIDLDSANPEKVRAQLTEYELVAEEYGGDIPFVDISAKKRLHIDDLLETIVTTSDILVNPTANANKPARGIAIEAKLDQGRGSVITALIQDGTLRVGDPIVVGDAYGRVRAMVDEKGAPVAEAGPSRPVQVLGLTSVPAAGDQLIVADDDRTARQIAERRAAARRATTLAKRRKRISLENLTEAIEEGKLENLNLIIKGDSSGSVEALESSLYDIEVGGDEVQLNVIHRGVGAVTQSDVNLATVDNAIIIGFNVRPAERVQDMAEREGVEMKFYSVIYDAINDVEDALKGKLKPIYEEVMLGTAEIRQIFKSGKFGNIAGSIVRSGKIKRHTKARLVRDGAVVAPELEIVSLRREKDDATEVKEGFECGITLGYKDIRVGDLIETWEMREKPRE